jgi:hypothetical protein
MQDSMAESISHFKNTVFLWEVIITAIVFTAAWFILKRFKEKESKSRKENKKYHTGESAE